MQSSSATNRVLVEGDLLALKDFANGLALPLQV